MRKDSLFLRKKRFQLEGSNFKIDNSCWCSPISFFFPPSGSYQRCVKRVSWKNKNSMTSQKDWQRGWKKEEVAERERDGKGVEEGGHGESSTFSSTRCQRQVMWVPWVAGCQTASVFAESANSILLQPPSLHHCSVGKAIGKMGDKRVGQHMVKWRGLILERKGGKPRMNGETGISAREWTIWRSSLEPSMIVDVK